MFAVVPHYEQPQTNTVRHSSPSPGPTSPVEGSSSSGSSAEHTSPSSPVIMPAHGPPVPVKDVPPQAGKPPESLIPTAGPSTLPPPVVSSEKLVQTPRKSSTFRHVPLRPQNARQMLPSSPLRPVDSHSRTPSSISSSSRYLDPLPRIENSGHVSSDLTSSPVAMREGALSSASVSESLPYPASPQPSVHSPQPQVAVVTDTLTPVQRSTSQGRVTSPQTTTSSSLPTSPAPGPSPASSSTSLPTARGPTRSSVPYRPGFQPKGVYRPRTDEFLIERKAKQDEGRIEHARLERRLEKLIDLHFSGSDTQKDNEKESLSAVRPRQQNKRLSSIFDLDLSDLRNKSAGELWRDVLQSQAPHNAKADIRGTCYYNIPSIPVHLTNMMGSC